MSETMELPLTGGCICGAMRYEITAAPVDVYACHCSDCQRITSSAFSIGVVVSELAFRATGKAPKVATGGMSAAGRPKSRLICPDCGTWVFGRPRDGQNGDLVRIVRGGTFDKTKWIEPKAHFWTQDKQSWVLIPEGVARWEKQARS